MQSVLSSRLGQAALAAVLLTALWSMPAAAQSLFTRHEVTAQFATSDGKPMADAEVKVFAPGEANRPALTGRTDKDGKFEFPADEGGFWTAEAHNSSEVARVMVRVGGGDTGGRNEPPSLFWLIGGLLLLLILAFGYRVARARSRRPRG